MFKTSRAGRRYLLDQERVLHAGRSHPVVLLRPFGWWVLSMLVAWVAGSAAVSAGVWPVVSDLLGGAAAAVTLWTAVKVLRWCTACYVITDQRVLVLSGVLSVKARAIPLAKVTETTFRRSLPGRVLGYADLGLRLSDGKDGVCRLERVVRPKQSYRLLSGLVSGSLQGAEVIEGPGRIFSDPSLDETGRLPRVIL